MFETLLNQQVQGVMQILGQTDGLAPTVTYMQAIDAGTAYDPSTGTMTQAATAHENIPAVQARYESEEIDGNKIVVNDEKVLIAKLDLPVTPSVNDRIIKQDATAWMIMSVGGVPGESLWVLQVRETHA